MGTWIHTRADPPRRIFYVQEVLPPDHPAYVYDGNLRIRALHSERDTVRHAFTHVDGKIEIHSLAGWQPSREAPTAPLPAFTASRKLWRVDAANEMDDAAVVRLDRRILRRNELVAEHFSALEVEYASASGIELGAMERQRQRQRDKIAGSAP